MTRTGQSMAPWLSRRMRVLAVVAVIAAGAMMTLWTARGADRRMRGDLLARARLAAHGIDLGAVRALTGTAADLDRPAYLNLKAHLARLRQAAPDCRFIYLMGQRTDGVIFFFVDAEPVDGADESPAGQAYEEASEEFRAVFATGNEGTEGPFADRWGRWVSASIPLQDPATGGLLAVFGMDVDARDWRSAIATRCLVPAGSVVIALLAAYLSVVLLSSNRHIRASRAEVEERTESLRAALDRIRAIESVVERGPSVLFLWRIGAGDWSLDLVSHNVERVFGYRQEALLTGRVTWRSVMHPDDAPRIEGELADHLAQGGDEWSRTYRVVVGPGDVRWVRDWCRVLRDPRGQATHLQAVALDITDLKQAEAEKDRLQAQVVQAQKMESVGRLAGGVAHDFNNLLTAILGYVDICRERVGKDHAIRPYLDEVVADAQRSVALTRQLLAFARKQIISPTVLNLNDTVEGMLKLLRRLIGENIDVVWAPGHNLWLVRMDRSQVEQVLANLAVNARDAITGAGRITVSTANVELDDAFRATHPGAVPGAYVLVTVADNGCGMDAETMSHLFEPFYTTKGSGHGTGLGLATVFGIVKQNNGYVDAVSETGQGATFSVYVPRYAGPVVTDAAPVSAERQATGRKATILLVEDERSVRITTRFFLEAMGHAVLAADGPVEALALAARYAGEIDLLLTDVVMPDMNGRQLAERLHDLRPGMKCLYMSGYTEDEVLGLGVANAGVHFLGKPFTRDDLARKVRDVLDLA